MKCENIVSRYYGLLTLEGDNLFLGIYDNISTRIENFNTIPKELISIFKQILDEKEVRLVIVYPKQNKDDYPDIVASDYKFFYKNDTFLNFLHSPAFRIDSYKIFTKISKLYN